MIDAPWYQDSVSTLAFNAYASFKSRMEDLIDDFVAKAEYGFDINAAEIQSSIFHRYGFHGIEDFSQAEIEYIENEIQERFRRG